MNQEKVVFIIPGYKHTFQNKAYKKIAIILKKDGYQPIFIKISWKGSTITENTDFFLSKYKQIRSKRKYILGFSFGAMIAFLASTKVNVSGLILCSLSPYFKEDIPSIDKENVSILRKKRYRDFKTLQCSRLSKEVKTKQVLMLYGTEEEKSLIKRVYKVYRQIISKRKYLIPVEKTDHNIGDRRYLLSINQAAKFLN